jgi:hypothetical protein
MSILSIDLHSSKSTIRLSFHFQHVTYESLDDIYCSKFSTECNPHVLWMTTSTLRSIPPVRCRMSCCDSCCLPFPMRCNAASNWRMFCTGGFRACIRRPSMSPIRSMRFKSGLMAGQGTEVTASLGGRLLLLLNDEAWRCHPYTQAL